MEALLVISAVFFFFPAAQFWWRLAMRIARSDRARFTALTIIGAIAVSWYFIRTLLRYKSLTIAERLTAQRAWEMNWLTRRGV